MGFSCRRRLNRSNPILSIGPKPFIFGLGTGTIRVCVHLIWNSGQGNWCMHNLTRIVSISLIQTLACVFRPCHVRAVSYDLFFVESAEWIFLVCPKWRNPLKAHPFIQGYRVFLMNTSFQSKEMDLALLGISG